MLCSALAAVSPARADAACPGVFNGASCNGVCTTSSPADIACNLDDGGTSDTTGLFVTPTSTTFRAYGFASSGDEFCCEMADLTDGCNLDEITITMDGTAANDDIKLHDAVAGLDLACSVASVYAGAGIDTIAGSRSTANTDRLFGEDGVDVIHGWGGDDHIEGGNGDDLLFGETGIDVIRGGPGDDKIKGGAGSDDALEGDAGLDWVCGEAGDDYITGGVGNDVLFGGADTDYTAGGDGTDTCDGETDDGFCEGTSTSCPW